MRPFNILLSLLLSCSPAYGQRRFTSHNFNIQGGTGVGQGVGVGSNGGVGVGTGVGIGGSANVQILVDGNGGVKVRPNDACGGSDWILDQSTSKPLFYFFKEAFLHLSLIHPSVYGSFS